MKKLMEPQVHLQMEPQVGPRIGPQMNRWRTCFNHGMPSPHQSSRLEHLRFGPEGTASLELDGNPIDLKGAAAARPVAALRELFDRGWQDCAARQEPEKPGIWSRLKAWISSLFGREGAPRVAPEHGEREQKLERVEREKIERTAPEKVERVVPNALASAQQPAPPAAPEARSRASAKAAPERGQRTAALRDEAEQPAEPAEGLTPPRLSASAKPPPDRGHYPAAMRTEGELSAEPAKALTPARWSVSAKPAPDRGQRAPPRAASEPHLQAAFADDSGVHLLWQVAEGGEGAREVEMVYGFDSEIAGALQNCYGHLAELGFKVADLQPWQKTSTPTPSPTTAAMPAATPTSTPAAASTARSSAKSAAKPETTPSTTQAATTEATPSPTIAAPPAAKPATIPAPTPRTTPAATADARPEMRHDLPAEGPLLMKLHGGPSDTPGRALVHPVGDEKNLQLLLGPERLIERLHEAADPKKPEAERLTYLRCAPGRSGLKVTAVGLGEAAEGAEPGPSRWEQISPWFAGVQAAQKHAPTAAASAASAASVAPAPPKSPEPKPSEPRPKSSREPELGL
jgi:hypothetical protein